MTLTVQRFGLAAALAMVLGLLSLLIPGFAVDLRQPLAGEGEESRRSLVAQGQPPCTVTVQPGQSIQQAIDTAPEGAVICLTAGTWEENIEIAKHLTLRGAGQDQTVLEAKAANNPVLKIESNSPGHVVFVEGLAAIEASDSAGVLVRGKTRAILKRLRLLKSLYGLITVNSAQVNSSECEVLSNGIGLWVEHGQLDLVGCHISLSRSTGVIAAEVAVLNMVNSYVFENGFDGLFVESFSNVKVINSQIYRNQGWAGMSIGGALPEATIINSQIYANEGQGLRIRGSATVTVRNSTISSNGVSSYCSKSDFLCSGVELEDEAELTLSDSVIMSNADWGITAPLQQCGYSDDFFFVATAHFEEHNLIQNNNASGNLNGFGNPGNHPWNRPDVPDGQVCLP